MRRFRLRDLIAATFCSVMPVFALGCADNESMLFIRGVIRPDGDECTIDANPSAQMQLNGVLDVSFGSGYIAALLVGNQLTRQGDRDKVRTETARIALRGAVVKVMDPESGDTIDEYTTDGTGFADVGSGTEPGYGHMFAELVPPGLDLPVPGRINVGVRVFGDTLGGDEIESNELIFPIAVCRGCLISFPPEALDLQGNCINPKKTTVDAKTACNAGQDDPIECWDCRDYNPLCAPP